MPALLSARDLKIHPSDSSLCGAETAYDTGLTFATVFRALKSGKSVEEATQLVAHSAGCNAAHRCPPLAMAAFIADDDLVQTTMSETKITHVHQLAVESAVASSRICRELIQGSTWDDATSKV
jgi:ADP-ribosylglycohydrolase